ncbi:transporter substrate-binding domain-containing protein [Mycolicibacterium sp.]|uniref:transporter substrate-binding domain-containing protein n=1 Tax=Mycolicibacterium sp. TaxID=2320850 RepID=UPI0028A8C4A9|nr:transporter substrate-binding domain-containing protein [Mycolicibacterium sp.]
MHRLTPTQVRPPVLPRLRAAVLAVLLVLAIGALPALIPRANAAPRAVTVATYNVEPFVITEGAVKYGFTIDLLDEIAKRTGWDYTYLDAVDVPGLLGAVREGRADFGAANISITADREKIFNFSQPIVSAGLQIIVPAASTQRVQPGLGDFIKLLFSTTMAVWLLAAFVLTILPAHIIWALERGDPESMVARSYFPGIFQAFGWGLGMLAAAPFDSPRHWPIRIVTVLWTFVSIIFVAYYTAILTTNLTVAKISSQVSTPGDLIGKTVCTVANTTSTAALERLGVAFTGLPRVEDCYEGLEDGEFQAVVYDSPVLEYYVANQGAGVAAIAGPVFKDEDYGIVFPIGSNLDEEANGALLSIQEDGTYELLKKKWFGTPS